MNSGGDNNYWQPDPANDPFAPVQSDPNAPAPPPPAETPAEQPAPAPDAAPEPAPTNDAPVAEEPETEPVEEEIADDDEMETVDGESTELSAFEPIQWSSSSTIEHEHGANWNFALLGVAGLIIAGIVGWSIWQQNFSFSNMSVIGLVIVVVIAIMVVSKKPANEISYMLTESGLTIDGQLHPFSEFRAFGVHQDGALWQLTLIPVKRFGAAVTMFISAEQGEMIVDILGARLPMESISTHPIDKLARLLKL